MGIQETNCTDMIAEILSLCERREGAVVTLGLVQPSFVYLLPAGSFLDGLPKCCKPALSRTLVSRRLDCLIDRSVAFPFRTHPRGLHRGVQAGPAACFDYGYILCEMSANQSLDLLDDAVSGLVRNGSREMRNPREPNCEVDVRETELIT